MTAATSYEHRQHQHLPPSPPPSPPSTTRRRVKKKPDPFAELAAATPLPSQPSSPAHEQPDDSQESLLTRIILTPIFIISFIVSLFYINYRNRARRTEARAPNTSILNYLAPSRWLDPEPYQDPDNSTWGCRGASATYAEPNEAIGPKDGAKRKKRRSWHLNRKIRKMAKLEIGDALEMRGQIMAGMAVVGMLGCVVLWMVMKWCVVSMASMMFSAKK